MKFYLIFISILCITSQLKSGIIQEGTVGGTWTKTSSPYLIDGDIEIPEGTALLIEAGVNITFLGHHRIFVKGLLITEGTAAEPVVFSAKDQVSGWGGIIFENAHSNCKMIHTVMKYAHGRIDSTKKEMIKYVETLPGGIVLVNFREYGGAIACFNTKLLIDHCTFQNNVTHHTGGAIFICEKSRAIIQNSDFTKNKALRYGGGGISIWYSNVTFENCTFKDNAASKFTGGALDVQYYSICYLNNCQLSGNSAFAGGGINLLYSSKITIHDTYFSENYAKIGGGLNFNEKCEGSIVNSTFKNNFGVYGGGITVSEECQTEISYCDFSENRAKEMGGGIFIAEVSNASLINSIILDNISEENGGGIYCQDSRLDLRNNRITGNTANQSGGGIYFDFASANCANSSIHHNEAMRGGGIYFENCTETYFSDQEKCSIYLNRSIEIGNDLFAFVGPNINLSLDTFTVQTVTDLHAFPKSKFILNSDNFQLSQVHANLYVSSEGDDNNSGQKKSKPLKSLHLALSKLQGDSLHQHTIYLADGEYDSRMLTSNFSAQVLKWIKISPGWGAKMDFLPGKIVVYTPWWNTPWAYILYFGILAVVIVTGWRVRTNRLRLKHQAEIDHLRAEKLQEIDQVKSRFFANISHEFRTPLTLIKGPLDKLLSHTTDRGSQEQLSLIQRSAQRLQGLIEQLLDISKIEAGKMKLKARSTEISTFLKPLVLAFMSWAERKNIMLQFVSPDNNIEAYLDPEMMEKVINNLLSNALKFTPEGGEVVVTIYNPPVSPLPSGHRTGMHKGGIKGGSVKYIQISISDTGPGISPDQLPRIFDRFYQADDSAGNHPQSSGIGLALAKELVELHHGEIKVESEPGKGSTFKILLPLGKEHLLPEEIVPEAMAEPEERIPEEVVPVDEIQEISDDLRDNTQDIGVKLPTLLIVEDNADMRQYMACNFENEYRIITAVNGQDGFERSIEEPIDIVISDVMMPEMDGYTLCQKLKTDQRTSHIPVILLTARADAESKLEGLETGADDYITKPFDMKELKVRTKNLIDQRCKLKERFSTDPNSLADVLAVTSLDRQFLQKLISVLLANISDMDFSAEDCAREMGMSRSNIYRKLQALTGHSISSFIRLYRLKQAARLLRKQSGNVTQIAYDVGFNSLSYFSRCFQEQFGESPSHYARQD
ncbi:MAG: response regulator [Calditrichaeota bacterium]|nr:response regulator [Calditrichota bacterium]